ncbi:MAG: RCC1 domain-containing protein, partial [Chloroflexi bacterium]|nr:RCC1 domain-containing protein [Chloroflexota bacterium]
PPEPEPGMRYTAISSGANHVCAIATDGSIMCWGDNDYGQVSDRPTSGSFTQISSGDNHTCALRNDGAVICWGSIDVP